MFYLKIFSLAACVVGIAILGVLFFDRWLHKRRRPKPVLSQIRANITTGPLI